MTNKKDELFVSIIIPTYNRANLITRAINSILDQSYTNYEIIVVDDGSTDNTKEVIQRFNEDKINYYVHKKNRGAAAARNTGIKYSKGDFIAFQDSDDKWLPEKLEKEMDVFLEASDKIGVVYSGYWHIKDNKKIYIPTPKVTKKEGNIHFELLKGNFVSGLSVIRKICFKKVGLYDENLPNLEDWELYIRISKYFSFKFIDEPLSIAYCSSDSASINYSKNLKSSEIILKKHFADFNDNKEILAVNKANIGIYAFLNGDESKSRKYLMDAIRYNPLNIKYWLLYLVSFIQKKYYNIFLNVFFTLRKY
ncbi:glycosyltransferase family 2 protein [Methanobacterium spitsbergense]|uniref:Glycosyltransferase n=1 Tax=Methanobacterium spitsbergense TaxID=2874285 RepID=A0A8T5UVA9_9EURY|nr:glycosyltransferase [Methanobacterium spitsbergense]